ncbi:undecaprenyl-diphosphate phosphatase [Chengkuizengella axinellae]|uniref:Undecaprenyl-diphosphatase n=1 Tax=Chengkuizengella axinellae TaxID=3064388 RepID=A0ABT9IUN9_9BACL|nr:undecaprenyl-diphosphate phosphatase [Chengkuizengella sp. 2205SS18-9]MDP5273061.1 undecaprenyl-diphosphate phosphatase [Chengkuizengella sp. 2205SS18-9]
MELWELIKYIFLGVLQGFTEPIPVSSSGHVLLARHWFGIEVEGLSFEILVNFASLLAVLLIYRADLMQLTKHGFTFLKTRETRYKRDFMFIVYLIIATIPAAILGLTFEDTISSIFNENDVKVIGFALIVTGIALFIIRNLKGRKNDQNITLVDAVIVGLAQAVALIPGISRSGATIVAALARGWKQETAMRFSFFLYIPISVGVMVFGLSDMINEPGIESRILPYTLAFLGAFVASYFSLKWFMGIMQRGNLIIFTVYCLIIGAAVLIF